MNKTTTALALAGLAALTAGCSTISSQKIQSSRTNLTNEIYESSLSDRDFQIKHALVHFGTGEYLFGKIDSDKKIKLTGTDKILEAGALFPFWAIREVEALERFKSRTGEVIYRSEDGAIRAFVPIEEIINGHNPIEDYAERENPSFKKPARSPERFAQHVGPGRFSLELLDFSREGYHDVAFTTADINGKTRVLLITNPEPENVYRTGQQRVYGNIFVETKAELIEGETGIGESKIVSPKPYTGDPASSPAPPDEK